ncbi:MAG: type II toxin-antitoxin system HipA family toxin [Acidobacteria bacterium]|nr:type II toxin-antitoxin system HipA family toxin [Acidobacteriota bacterium]
MEREIFVSVDLHGTRVLVGRLWCRFRGGRESATFEYDAGWLEHPERFAIDPALPLTAAAGPFHTVRGVALFGAMSDSAPDRWGRMLLRRAARRRARRNDPAPRGLSEADVLLSVDDEARQGALRFAIEPEGPFLAAPQPSRIPPLVELRRLVASADRVTGDREDDEDLRLLIGPGSSLGGARPKAAVRLPDGALAIAKFPHTEDDRNVVLWEAVALALAERAGIEAPSRRIQNVGGETVLIVDRFDRRGGERIPFLSAMSLVGATDRETHSYLEIADALRQHGARPRQDLAQLWRRIVFNVLISNTDDHLRNHGFLHEGQLGWRLSPVYDLNPTPTDVRPRVLSTSIGFDDPAASLDLALETAESYGLEAPTARGIAGEVGAAVAAWKQTAERLGAARRETDRLASAFENEDLVAALAMR